jgi:hypothetical protein
MVGAGLLSLDKVQGFCEHCIEPSDCMKGGEFCDHLSDYQPLKEDWN